MVSETDKRFFALFLKQRKHEAKFGGSSSRESVQDIEAKYEQQWKITENWSKTSVFDTTDQLIKRKSEKNSQDA